MERNDTMLEPDWNQISDSITAMTGSQASLQACNPEAGGDINRAFSARFGKRRLFIKLNSATYADMFEAEHEALSVLRGSETLRVPDSLCFGKDDHHAWLVLEFLELRPQGKAGALGKGLAAMHRVTSERFGWHRDNTIGTTGQINSWATDWVDFWRRQRLGQQLRLACDNGFATQLEASGEELLLKLPALFETYTPGPSLLHGDLWAGNHAYLPGGEPVIFDPASYYGDRETDIAMTELFGGFNPEFYAAYRADFPLDDGYPVRRTLYQLYHVLNHLNLFGGGYLARSVHMLEQLLSELR